jgi:hypothetical protein
MEGEAKYTTKYAGRVENELRDIVSDMSRQCFSVLASRGVLIGEKERIDLMQALHNAVTRSVEIEAAIVMLMERGDGPRAA